MRRAVDPLPARPAAPSGRPRDAAGSATHGDRQSSVLLLADPAAEGLPLLYIRRSLVVSSHRGQIAFPGGGAEGGDSGPEGTALREAHEEVGVPPDSVEVIGRLPALVTNLGGRQVDPIVGLARGPIAPTSDDFEVADWFWVPLARLLTAEITAREVPPGFARRPVHFIDLGDRIIWGATAAITVDLLDRLRAALATEGVAPQR